ncbi:MAG: HAD family hydrolase [Streptosporangiaceae bacterium]
MNLGRDEGRRRAKIRRLRRRHAALFAGEELGDNAARLEAPPQPAPDPDAAAFFDLDNTMMRGAAVYYFARGLASRKLFTVRDLVKFAWQQAMFRTRGTENPSHMRSVEEVALAFVAGRRVDKLVDLGEEIYDELVAERVWPGARALAARHMDAGQRVWLVTAAPVEMATIIARRLGLTGALGTAAETQDGAFTGRLAGAPLHGPAKAEAVHSLAAEHGLELSRCYAYSDSINDLPMLSLVGHPGAINPDSDLRAHAKTHGWRVYDFRTGRKATLIALGMAAGGGAVTGGIAAAIALRRRRRRWWRRALDP